MSDIQQEMTDALDVANKGRGINASGAKTMGVPDNRRSTLRMRITNALDRADPDALYKLAQRNPTLVIKIMAALEPKELSATIHHEAVQVVMYPCEPPPNWIPPSMAGEISPIIDVPDGDETPINVGEDES